MNPGLDVVLGDSQAEGLGPFLRARGFAVFDRRGWSTARLRGELATILPQRPARVILVTGGNDDPDAPGYSQLVRDTIAQIRAAGAQAVIVGPVFARVAPDSLVHPRTAAKIRAAVQGTGGTFIDGQELTRDLARTENVHLTREGYRVYAERLEKALRGGSGVGFGLLALVFAVGYALWRSRR